MLTVEAGAVALVGQLLDSKIEKFFGADATAFMVKNVVNDRNPGIVDNKTLKDWKCSISSSTSII